MNQLCSDLILILLNDNMNIPNDWRAGFWAAGHLLMSTAMYFHMRQIYSRFYIKEVIHAMLRSL